LAPRRGVAIRRGCSTVALRRWNTEPLLSMSKPLSTAVWYLLRGKPLPEPYRERVIEILRSHPEYAKGATPQQRVALGALPTAKTSYPTTWDPSPNRGGMLRARYIVLHDSFGSYSSGRWWILDHKSDVSYHYLVNTDGACTQFVEENRQAWHAGRSRWQGLSGLNRYSIGLSLTDNTHKREVTVDEIESLAILIKGIIRRHPDMQGRPLEQVILTHQMIAPTRKIDTAPHVRDMVIDRVREL